MKNIDIITLFPEIIEGYILSQPFAKNISPEVNIEPHQLRDFSPYKHRQVDDKQYGTDPGMVLMPEPLSNAVDLKCEKCGCQTFKNTHLILILL